MTDDTIVHEHPVWRERADFIIAAEIDPPSATARWRWEQLWARQVAKNRFRLCCIPFFIYDLALDDEVEAGEEAHRVYVVERVTKPSGRYTFRAWFHNSDVRREVADELVRLGCLIEWRSVRGNLLAIDAASDSLARAAADFLWDREQRGQLTYEAGRTKVD